MSLSTVQYSIVTEIFRIKNSSRRPDLTVNSIPRPRIIDTSTGTIQMPCRSTTDSIMGSRSEELWGEVIRYKCHVEVQLIP